MLVFYLKSENKKGIVIPLVLGILLILGFLANSFYQMVLTEKNEEWRRYQKTQAEFSILSGIEYTSKKIKQSKEPWRTSELKHASSDSAVVFSVAVEQEGSFGIAKVKSNKPEDSLVFRIGYLLKNKQAFTLLDPSASIALAGNASIDGNVAMHHPRVEKSTHYKMPATSLATFKGDTIGENNPLWDSIAFYPENTRNFINAKRNIPKNKCLFDAKDVLSGDYYCKSIVIQGDANCISCRLFAEKIIVRGRSNLKKALLTANTIQLEEEALISGEVLARDTITINLEKKQIGKTVYTLLGQKKGPVEYVGHINMIRFEGEALVLYLGDHWDSSLPGQSVSIKEAVKLRGLVIVNGNIEIQGEVRGGVVASYLGFEESGTFWRGFLKNGKIISDTSITILVPDAFRMRGELTYEYK